MMAQKNLKDLILHTLKDVYFAEHEILKALPEMEAAAESQRLREAFSTHRRQTEQQIERLKQVLQSVGARAEGVPCEDIQGILAEGGAELAERDEAEQLLERTLDEEKATDVLLTEIAEEMANLETV